MLGSAGGVEALKVPEAIERWVTPVRRHSLNRRYLLRMLPRGGVCAEIGVWKGDFSAAILRKTKPTRLHLIDPWRFETDPEYSSSYYGGAIVRDQGMMNSIYERVCERFRPAVERGTVRIHRQTGEEAALELDDGYFDWVYIDGNHLYEYVKMDLANFFPKVKSGGLIAGDDYGAEGWWDGGVERAVDEFCESMACEVVTTRRHQFVLRKS